MPFESDPNPSGKPARTQNGRPPKGPLGSGSREHVLDRNEFQARPRCLRTSLQLGRVDSAPTLPPDGLDVTFGEQCHEILASLELSIELARREVLPHRSNRLLGATPIGPDHTAGSTFDPTGDVGTGNRVAVGVDPPPALVRHDALCRLVR